jgi:hypothetical protein
MKKEQLYEAIGQIDEAYLQDTHGTKGKSTPSLWFKFGTVAASFGVVLLLAYFILNSSLWNRDLPPTATTEATMETAFGTRYVYRVKEGDFSAYRGGKVIDKALIGEKIETVTVSAGWITEEGQAPTDEELTAEVYTITGVSTEVAAALRFLDKGDALTTTHYYVILNPEADLSPVADYVIPDYMPNNPGEE